MNKDGRPPCVHLLLGWKGTEYKVEVMLMLKAFVEFKKAQHKAYDVTRAKNYEDLLADIGAHTANMPPPPPPSGWASCASGESVSAFVVQLLERDATETRGLAEAMERIQREGRKDEFTKEKIALIAKM